MSDSPHDLSRPGLKRVIADTYRERIRQQQLGKSDSLSLDQWLTVIGDGYGQLCREVIIQRRQPNQAEVRDQLISLAAAVLAAAEHLDHFTITTKQPSTP